MWSLCLVAVGQRQVVQVNPSDTAVKDLYGVASEAFGNSIVTCIKAGFPPQSLDDNDRTLLAESPHVSNQERLQVVLGGGEVRVGSIEKAKKKACGPSGRKTALNRDTAKTSTRANVEEESASTGRRPKRAAAKAATDSFAEVIRQQDNLLRSEKQQRSVRKARRVTTSDPPSSSSSKPKRSTKFTSQAPGRRLADGAFIGSPRKRIATSSGQQKRQSQKHEDISVALLSSLNDRSTAGRILRRGMTNAVHNSYEMTKASTRLAALESRNPETSVQMEKLESSNRLKVKFEKGVQGRGHWEETVDFIPAGVLKQVILAIQKSNPEGLRPHNMAFLSPRVLWSLAYDHFERQKQQSQRQMEAQPWEPFSLEETYRHLLPDCDWSFLQRRKQTLSEKAKENLRQLQEDSEDGQLKDGERGADAILDVENAMANLHQYDRSQRAERVAHAALARQKQRQLSSLPPEDWHIVTPNELDKNELTECVSTTLNGSDNERGQVVNALVIHANTHNWRELANQKPANLLELLSKDKELNYITLDDVFGWIEHARAQSLEEIMVAICDDNPSNVEVLREKANAGTPKDLAMWKSMPDLLVEELGDSDPTSLSQEDVARYCDRAVLAIGQLEWLEWFITSM